MDNILTNIKIIEFNKKYSKEVNNFVNLSMHNFIGRPFKQRKDLINIEEYYIEIGWQQINNLEIDMHFADDDDFFKKDL